MHQACHLLRLVAGILLLLITQRAVRRERPLELTRLLPKPCYSIRGILWVQLTLELRG